MYGVTSFNYFEFCHCSLAIIEILILFSNESFSFLQSVKGYSDSYFGGFG